MGEAKDWERKYFAIQEICADSLANSIKGVLHQANNTPQIRADLRRSQEQRRIEQQRRADMQLWQQMKTAQYEKELDLLRRQEELHQRQREHAKPPVPEPFVQPELAAAPLGEAPAVDSVDPPAGASGGPSA